MGEGRGRVNVFGAMGEKGRKKKPWSLAAMEC